MAYRDGVYMPKSDIRIGLDDLGFERGFGVFDYMRQLQGRIPFLADHLERLNHSQSVLNFQKPLDMAHVQEVIQQLITTNALGIGIPFNHVLNHCRLIVETVHHLLKHFQQYKQVYAAEFHFVAVFLSQNIVLNRNITTMNA